MAQSVEKLPSENHAAPTYAGQDINIPPSAYENGIFAFFSSLSNAFPIDPEPEKVDSEENFKQSLLKGVQFGTFLVVNYFLSKLIVSLQYFAAIHTLLDRFSSVLFALLSLPLSYFALRNTFESAFSDIKHRKLSVSICQSLAVAISAVFLLYTLVFDFDLLMKTGTDRNFIVLTFLLSLANYFDGTAFLQIIKQSGFDLSLLSKSLRTATGEGEVHYKHVRLGDILVAEAGSIVAFDGIVIDGQAQVLEAIYSPKGQAGVLQANDRVFAGSSILKGKIIYKVEALGPDSAISEFGGRLNKQLLENATQEIQNFNSTQTIANMLCIFFALGAGLFWLARFQSPAIAVSVTTAILLINLTSRLIQINLIMPIFTNTAGFYKGIFYLKPAVEKALSGLRRLVLDYSSRDRQEVVKLVKFELIDKRVDEKSLPSVLLALAGRGSGPESRAITHHITIEGYDTDLYPIEDYIEYFSTEDGAAGYNSVRGFVGKVSGVDFTVGNEDFLLERGVLVQASELDDSENPEEGKYYWYAALQREVIAYLYFSKENPEEIKKELNGLRAQGYKATLCSRDENEKIDKLAQEFGFELADIYGGLSEDNYLKKLESLKPFALYSSSELPEKLKLKSEVTISNFDPIRYNVSNSDTLIFDKEIKTIFDSVLIPLSSKKIETQNFYIATTLSLLLLALCVMNLISPIVCLLAVMCASIVMLLNLQRLGRF